MGKSSHKVFKDVVNKLNNALTTLGESGSEVSHLIPKPMNFAEVARSPADVKMAWLKSTFKLIKKLIKNKSFLMDELQKGGPVILCIDVQKAKIQSDGSLDKFKLRIVQAYPMKNA